MAFDEISQLILGVILILCVTYDFFYTTLSNSGAGFISSGISILFYSLVQYLFNFTGRRIYRYSGLLINLLIFFVWLGIVWLGLFLIFSSDSEGITNLSGRAANNSERLYFAAYVLSTLGIGNFFPTTHAFEIVTGIFSMFGFIFFTTSITYFLSVSGAVINKRSLARSINNLGKNPKDIADKLSGASTSFFSQEIINIVERLDRHVISHQAFPVVHYYNHPSSSVCLGINVVRLDEALSLLLGSEKDQEKKNEMLILRNSITIYFSHLDKNYSRSSRKGTGLYSSEKFGYAVNNVDGDKLMERRKALVGVLRSEGFAWKDVAS